MLRRDTPPTTAQTAAILFATFAIFKTLNLGTMTDIDDNLTMVGFFLNFVLYFP